MGSSDSTYFLTATRIFILLNEINKAMTELLELRNNPEVRAQIDWTQANADQLYLTGTVPYVVGYREALKAYPDLDALNIELGKLSPKYRFRYETFLQGGMYGFPACCSAWFGNHHRCDTREELTGWADEVSVPHFRYNRCPLCREAKRFTPVVDRAAPWKYDMQASELLTRAFLATRITDVWLLSLYKERLEKARYDSAIIAGVMDAAGFKYTLEPNEVICFMGGTPPVLRHNGRIGIAVVNIKEFTQVIIGTANIKGL